jgi:hypothetical protein
VVEAIWAAIALRRYAGLRADRRPRDGKATTGIEPV